MKYIICACVFSSTVAWAGFIPLDSSLGRGSLVEDTDTGMAYLPRSLSPFLSPAGYREAGYPGPSNPYPLELPGLRVATFNEAWSLFTTLFAIPPTGSIVDTFALFGDTKMQDGASSSFWRLFYPDPHGQREEEFTFISLSLYASSDNRVDFDSQLSSLRTNPEYQPLFLSPRSLTQVANPEPVGVGVGGALLLCALWRRKSIFRRAHYGKAARRGDSYHRGYGEG